MLSLPPFISDALDEVEAAAEVEGEVSLGEVPVTPELWAKAGAARSASEAASGKTGMRIG
jgi:hypothetical protein